VQEFFDCIENNKLAPVAGAVAGSAAAKAKQTVPAKSAPAVAVKSSTVKPGAPKQHVQQVASKPAVRTGKTASAEEGATPASRASSSSSQKKKTLTNSGSGSDGARAGRVVISLDEEDSPSFEDALRQSALPAPAAAAQARSDRGGRSGSVAGKQLQQKGASRLGALRYCGVKITCAYDEWHTSTL
jgi:hypothetical protein